MDLAADGACSCFPLVAGFPHRHDVVGIHLMEGHLSQLVCHLHADLSSQHAPKPSKLCADQADWCRSGLAAKSLGCINANDSLVTQLPALQSARPCVPTVPEPGLLTGFDSIDGQKPGNWLMEARQSQSCSFRRPRCLSVEHKVEVR